eukprot:Partr_v1_DN26809_c0_g1_i1_m40168 putative Dynein, axonemal, intermediate chain 2
MEIVSVYQRKRKEFGRQPLFSDRPAVLTANIAPDAEYMNNYIVKNPTSSSTSCCPSMSEHEVNTESHSVASVGVLHREGGWPKDVDSTDVEHKLRYRKKVEKDEEYIRVVKSLCDTVQTYIQQNNAVDIYEEYFTGIGEDAITIDTPSSRTLNVFRDPNSVKRPASFLSWHPDGGKKLAIAYSNLDFQKPSPNSSFESYIWDVEYPNAPDQKIIPPAPLVCLKYNLKDQHALIGGMTNGLVGVWDVRKGPYPVDTSIIDKSHKDMVSSVTMVNSKTGSEFFSTATDGQVLWWDTRKLSEPTEVMVLDPDKNGVLAGGTVTDFESTMPTKFMVGSESGSVFLCNKKAKTANERITHTFPGHHGPIMAIQRNPFFPRNFLTVADWSAKIWADDLKTPILTSRYHGTYLTDGCWSPTRPAVFCTGRNDGSVDFWDYLFKQNEPTLTLQISNSPISCLRIQDNGRWVAAGSKDGNTTMAQVSDSLSKMQNNEKSTFSQMLERESKREKLLESVAREKRLKMQNAKPAGAVPTTLENTIDEIMKKADEEFFQSTRFKR